MNRYIPCPDTHCGGTGQVDCVCDDGWDHELNKVCWRCDGTGWAGCLECEGTGQIVNHLQLERTPT